ncbi:hypothetical protein JDV02_000267 [Purpureocillium takamizusanense]|uniref:Zn(2)-C6 fungal-type domain-containing protein n=1 Tax=Purpureocillium takamizusanense TaxID=2060973 RepID=A0A9Q8Q6M9_9HYPO|nr:uncharacterized protein JDV02_000267 [Purpureocillium takamizusanense]UNI13529.1 hypothetical protein JDV02_000267 [Purpureocillium takamizusanense]
MPTTRSQAGRRRYGLRSSTASNDINYADLNSRGFDPAPSSTAASAAPAAARGARQGGRARVRGPGATARAAGSAAPRASARNIAGNTRQGNTKKRSRGSDDESDDEDGSDSGASVKRSDNSSSSAEPAKPKPKGTKRGRSVDSDGEFSAGSSSSRRQRKKARADDAEPSSESEERGEKGGVAEDEMADASGEEQDSFEDAEEGPSHVDETMDDAPREEQQGNSEEQVQKPSQVDQTMNDAPPAGNPHDASDSDDDDLYFVTPRESPERDVEGDNASRGSGRSSRRGRQPTPGDGPDDDYVQADASGESDNDNDDDEYDEEEEDEELFGPPSKPKAKGKAKAKAKSKPAAKPANTTATATTWAPAQNNTPAVRGPSAFNPSQATRAPPGFSLAPTAGQLILPVPAAPALGVTTTATSQPVQAQAGPSHSGGQASFARQSTAVVQTWGSTANTGQQQQLVRAERKTRRQTVTDGNARPCRHCRNEGAEQAQIIPCDWYMVSSYKVECTNCANYRKAGHPGHGCITLRLPEAWHRYATDDPVGFDPTACDGCIQAGTSWSCDVDTTLNYACTNCKSEKRFMPPPPPQPPATDETTGESSQQVKRRERVKGGKTEKRCFVQGIPMLKPPNPRQGYRRWYRHMCDGCRKVAGNGQKNGTPCTWLSDRTTWDEPCEQCKAKGIPCTANSIPIGSVPQVILFNQPAKWTVTITMAPGWMDLRRNSPGRRQCFACRRDDGHCRSLLGYPDSACNHCFQLGLDCFDHGAADNSTFHSLFDLSRVGFGKQMPYRICARCLETGRNCDKQRPCDSCVQNGEEHLCDAYDDSHQTFNGRVSPGPGALYYLALGYGPEGVNDVKSGMRLCHWVGPAYPCYGVDPNRTDTNYETKTWSALLLRRYMMPGGVPPFGGPNGRLFNRLPSGIQAHELDQWVLEGWPTAHLIMQEHKIHELLAWARETEFRKGESARRSQVRRLKHIRPPPEGSGDEDDDDEDGGDGGGGGDGGDDDAPLPPAGQPPRKKSKSSAARKGSTSKTSATPKKGKSTKKSATTATALTFPSSAQQPAAKSATTQTAQQQQQQQPGGGRRIVNSIQLLMQAQAQGQRLPSQTLASQVQAEQLQQLQLQLQQQLQQTISFQPAPASSSGLTPLQAASTVLDSLLAPPSSSVVGQESEGGQEWQPPATSSEYFSDNQPISFDFDLGDDFPTVDATTTTVNNNNNNDVNTAVPPANPPADAESPMRPVFSDEAFERWYNGGVTPVAENPPPTTQQLFGTAEEAYDVPVVLQQDQQQQQQQQIQQQYPVADQPANFQLQLPFLDAMDNAAYQLPFTGTAQNPLDQTAAFNAQSSPWVQQTPQANASDWSASMPPPPLPGSVAQQPAAAPGQAPPRRLQPSQGMPPPPPPARGGLFAPQQQQQQQQQQQLAYDSFTTRQASMQSIGTEGSDGIEPSLINPRAVANAEPTLIDRDLPSDFLQSTVESLDFDFSEVNDVIMADFDDVGLAQQAVQQLQQQPQPQGQAETVETDEIRYEDFLHLSPSPPEQQQQ